MAQRLTEGFQQGYESARGSGQQGGTFEGQQQQQPFLATLRGSDPSSWQRSTEERQRDQLSQDQSKIGGQSQLGGTEQSSWQQSGGQYEQGQQGGQSQLGGLGQQQYDQPQSGSGYGQQIGGRMGGSQYDQSQSGYGQQTGRSSYEQQQQYGGAPSYGGQQYGQQLGGQTQYDRRSETGQQQQQMGGQFEYEARPYGQQQYSQQQGYQQYQPEQRGKKNIVVFGGTGSQGQSIVNELIKSGRWNIRVPCRDPSRETQGSDWERQGVDLCCCDWNDLRAVEQCLEGSFACFLNINYWESNIRDKEDDLAIQIMQIAKRAGVQQLIYSALPHVEAITRGNLKVQHFSTKGRAMEECKRMGFQCVTYLLPSFYYSNWFIFFPPQVEQDGGLTWTIPGRGNQFSSYDAYSDTGRAVRAILENPNDFNCKHVCLEGDCLKVTEVMDRISAVAGRKVKCRFVEYDKFAEMRREGGRENAEMFQWFDNYGYFGPTYDRKDCIKWNKNRDPQMKSFFEWLQTGTWRDLLNKFHGIRL